MVSSRLVRSPSPSPAVVVPDLPKRIFAVGHEPVGIRASPYHKSRAIKTILNALEDDEVEVISQSPFGKFISLADEPIFSGRFGRFLLSRLLRTKKKHEAWFLFAGNPVRFSLREFAIITGLPCGKYPTSSKKKMKKNIKEKPYWPSLFGKLETVSVKSVIKMLRKKTVTDKETRVKYACLALLASVLLPTTHYHKISKDHAEMIKDINEFFAYPWGRLSFDMLMKGIKERNEISLSQDTVSLSGFALSLQLVFTAAVPALTEVVQEKCSSSSESDSEEEDGEERRKSVVAISLNPAHARELNKMGNTIVHSIIPDDSENVIDMDTIAWSDEEDDDKVDTMVRLVSEGHHFCETMFTGGATKADVQRMREEAKAKQVDDRVVNRKRKSNTSGAVQTNVDASEVGAVVVNVEGIDSIIETLTVDISVRNQVAVAGTTETSVHIPEVLNIFQR